MVGPTEEILEKARLRFAPGFFAVRGITGVSNRGKKPQGLIMLSMENAADKEAVSERGAAFYQTIQTMLEKESMGQVVAIHPDSGAYVVAKNRQEAVRKLKALQPVGLLFVTRIGLPTSADLSVIERMSGFSLFRP